MSHKLHVVIDSEQYSDLREISGQTGASMGELVRRALRDTYHHGSLKDQRLSAFDAGFGAWRGRPKSEDSYAKIKAGRRQVKEW